MAEDDTVFDAEVEDTPEAELDVEDELEDEVEIDQETVSVDAVIEAEDEADLTEDEFAPEDEEAPLDKILAERTGGGGLTPDDEPEGAVVDIAQLDADDRISSGDGIVAKRQGEFTCTSCFLVKHPSQLADPKRMLCRDCV